MSIRTIARATGVAALIGATLWLARRLWQTRVVPREFWHPGLLLPVTVRADWMLKFGRIFVPAGEDMLDQSNVHQVEIEGGLDGYLHVPRERHGFGEDERLGAVLWLHGGGLIGGKPELEQSTAHKISDEVGVIVLNARYRLAPEHRFPAAFDDAYAALVFLHAHAEEWGIDPHRIAVAGESAGAGLAAAVAQKALDSGLPVKFQALVYPMLDDRTAAHDHHEGRGQFIWTPRSNRYAWGAYLGQAPRSDREPPPYAAAGRRKDLAGLPPTWIGVGDLDLFYSENVAYARRLREAGVEVQERHVVGMYHGADELAANDPNMRAFRESMLEALRVALAPGDV